MNDFFDLDAPLFRFLTRVADMVILSLLWLIGSLPLFTLGISSTAWHLPDMRCLPGGSSRKRCSINIFPI